VSIEIRSYLAFRTARTKTVIYPNIDSVVLSRIQLILYSKFWAATNDWDEMKIKVVHESR
jgi:hypothetical protein